MRTLCDRLWNLQAKFTSCVNHIPGIHDNGPRDHELWRRTLTAYYERLMYHNYERKINMLSSTGYNFMICLFDFERFCIESRFPFFYFPPHFVYTKPGKPRGPDPGLWGGGGGGGGDSRQIAIIVEGAKLWPGPVGVLPHTNIYNKIIYVAITGSMWLLWDVRGSLLYSKRHVDHETACTRTPVIARYIYTP